MPSDETPSPTEIEAARDRLTALADSYDDTVLRGDHRRIHGMTFHRLGNILDDVRLLLAAQEAERRDSERWRAIHSLHRDGRLPNFLVVCDHNDIPLATGMDALLSREPSLAALQPTTTGAQTNDSNL